MDLCLVMEDVALLGIELHLPNSSPGEKLVDVILHCKMRQSAGLVIVHYIMQSSANIRISDWMLLVLSLMYRRKRRGPRTVPCGTPDVTGSLED